MAEGLQIAQVIADLQTLQNADPKASQALLTAASNPPPSTTSQRPAPPPYTLSTPPTNINTNTPRKSSLSNLSLHQAHQQQQQPRFDKLGRRIIVPRSASTQPQQPPPLHRTGSSFARLGSAGNGGNNGAGGFGSGARSLGGSLSASRSGSGVGTPVEETPDEDMKRARTLLELFEMRGKFKQMGDTGLTRAKQRVDHVVDKYAKMDLEEREKAAKARHSDA